MSAEIYYRNLAGFAATIPSSAGFIASINQVKQTFTRLLSVYHTDSAQTAAVLWRYLNPHWDQMTSILFPSRQGWKGGAF